MGGGHNWPSNRQHVLNEHVQSGNPIIPGWYADPDSRIFEGQYWIFPSLSLDYDQQTYFDCFSSPDLITWTKHERILDFADIPWSTNRAAWAPTVAFRNGAYYMYFSAGDGAGIGVAKSTTGPAGPYTDVLGKPLVRDVIFGGQPIDPAVFIDDDGNNSSSSSSNRAYLLWGGWSHGLGAELSDDMISFKTQIVELTPPNYVEVPHMFKRRGVYYYMYSVGGWGGNSYGVEYMTSTTSPLGPFTKPTTVTNHILSPHPDIAQGTGSNGVLHVPGTDRWFITYHRRPLGDFARDHRYVCIDNIEFDDEGHIKPVKITMEGVAATPLNGLGS